MRNNSRVKLLKMYVDYKPYALLHLAARKATGLDLTKITHKTMRHFTVFSRRKVSHMCYLLIGRTLSDRRHATADD